MTSEPDGEHAVAPRRQPGRADSRFPAGDTPAEVQLAALQETRGRRRGDRRAADGKAPTTRPYRGSATLHDVCREKGRRGTSVLAGVPGDVRRPVLVLALAVLTLLAGCATAPDGTPTTPAANETFAVEMTGNSSATFVVSAELVADPASDLTVSYANGSTRTVAVPDEPGRRAFGPDSGATAVEPGGAVVGGVHFEGSPAFSATANAVPATPTAVYTVRELGDDALIAWGVVRCERHVAGISMTVEGSRVAGLGVGCGSAA